MGKEGRAVFLSIAVASFLLLNALPASGKEDTVHLSFQKTALSEDTLETYTVKKGDWLLGIIQKKYGGTKQQNRQILGTVKRLNPHVKNVDIIFPGQELVFPTQIVGESEILEEKVIEVESPDGTATSLVYTVKEGDTVIDIIRRRLGKTIGESFALMEAVRKLNPHIPDLNRIFPGQAIYVPLSEEIKAQLPEPEEVKEPEKVETAKFHVSLENHFAVIKSVARPMGGTMVREGSFYIPMPPSGQFALDTAKIPLVEMENGRTIFLDRDGLIPETVAKVIESTWKSYSVMKWRGEDELPALIGEFVERAADYTLEKKSATRALDREKRIVVAVDWEAKKNLEGNETGAFAVNFIDDMAACLPANVKTYARHQGYEIVEILRDLGIAESESFYPPQKHAVLDSETTRTLTESLLTALGFEAIRNSKVRVFSMEEDGFNLSVRADLLLDENGKNVMINFKPRPPQFIDILGQRGWRIVIVSDTDAGKSIIESILTVLDISFTDDTFEFSLSGATDRNDSRISITGIRMEGEGGPLFFVDYATDADIYGLLRGRWGVRLLQY